MGVTLFIQKTAEGYRSIGRIASVSFFINLPQNEHGFFFIHKYSKGNEKKNNAV